MKMNENINLFKIYFKFLKVAFSKDKKYFLFIVVSRMLQGVLAVISIFYSTKLFNSINDYNFVDEKTLLLLIAFYLIFIMSDEIINGIGNYSTEYFSKSVLENLYAEIFLKTKTTNTINFEDRFFMERLQKVKNEVESAYFSSLLFITLWSFYGVFFVGIFIFLTNVNILTFFSVFLVFVPVIVFQKFIRKNFIRDRKEISHEDRKKNYFKSLFIDRNNFMEIKSFSGEDFFIDKFMSAINRKTRKIRDLELKNFKLELSSIILSRLVFILILGINLQQVIIGRLSSGVFVGLISTVFIIYNYANECFGGVLKTISKSSHKIADYLNFLEDRTFEKEKANIEKRHTESNKDIVSLKNVFFKYPNADKWALKNINITIKEKETIAIVGENGSGKTTLSKILLGIFEPTNGFIYTNQDLYNPSALFQKYARLKVSIKENINFNENHNEKEDKKIISLLSKFNIEIEKPQFKYGLDTILAKEFGGTDLSGGQWQRIALARSQYKKSDFFVLDEPTSAIDPIEETKIINKFIEIAKNKSVVIISHRLGICKTVNKIVVMDKGEIIDIGNHKDLVNRCQIYKKMWQLQSKYYLD